MRRGIEVRLLAAGLGIAVALMVWILFGLARGDAQAAACPTRADLPGGIIVTSRRGFEVTYWTDGTLYWTQRVEPEAVFTGHKPHPTLHGVNLPTTVEDQPWGATGNLYRGNVAGIDAALAAGEVWSGRAVAFFEGAWIRGEGPITLAHEGTTVIDVGGCSYDTWVVASTWQRGDGLTITDRLHYAPDLGYSFWLRSVDDSGTQMLDEIAVRRSETGPPPAESLPVWPMPDYPTDPQAGPGIALNVEIERFWEELRRR